MARVFSSYFLSCEAKCVRCLTSKIYTDSNQIKIIAMFKCHHPHSALISSAMPAPALRVKSGYPHFETYSILNYVIIY